MKRLAEIIPVREAIWGFYAEHGRHDLPWRQPEADGQFDPYKIVVSELMLQQTQVPRVIPKFIAFTSQFPTFAALAAALLADVLRAWSGLGYNRRAKFLWQTAQQVEQEFGGALPSTQKELVRLPGIGSNTAGAILAYAYNQPASFVETNIRNVFIHHFFKDELQVADADILPLLRAMLAGEPEPRTFYWALMDYGTYLKQAFGNAARVSSSYTRQSKFAGSRRQVRGQVLRLLGMSADAQTLNALSNAIVDERLPSVLDDLVHEGLVVAITPDLYRLP